MFYQIRILSFCRWFNGASFHGRVYTGETRESLHGRVRVVIYNSDSEIRKNFNTRTRSAKLKILRTLQDQGELLTTRKNIRDLTLIPLRFRVQLTIDKMITEVSQTQSLDKTNMLVNHMGHNDKEGTSIDYRKYISKFRYNNMYLGRLTGCGLELYLITALSLVQLLNWTRFQVVLSITRLTYSITESLKNYVLEYFGNKMYISISNNTNNYQNNWSTTFLFFDTYPCKSGDP